MSCSRFVSLAVRCWYHQDIVVVLCIAHHVVVWLFTLSRISIPVSPYCVFVSRSSFFCLGLLFFLVSRSLSHFYLFVVPRVCFVSQFRWFVSGNRFFCSRYFFYSQFVFCLAYLAIWLFIVSPSYRVGHVGRSIVWSRRPIDHALIRVSLCHFFLLLCFADSCLLVIVCS